MNSKQPLSDEQISRLYQAGRTEEPDPGSDRAILAAAHRVSKTRPAIVRPFSGRWQAPAAMAAMLLIGVLVVPDLFREQTGVQVRAPEQTIRETSQPLQESLSLEVQSEPEVTVPEQRSIVSGRAQPAEPMSPTSVAIKARKRTEQVPAKVQSRLVTEDMDSGNQPERREEMRVMMESAPLASEALNNKFKQKPEAWLARVRMLIDQGEYQMARQALDAFTGAYPDTPVAVLLGELDEAERDKSAGQPD